MTAQSVIMNRLLINEESSINGDFMYMVSNISKKYKNHCVLKNIAFSAKPGECICIAGANGCGKSTLLKIISGILKPDSGSITCFGSNLLADRRKFADFCGYVPQTNPLMEELSVQDNLLLWSGRKPKDMVPLLDALKIEPMLKTTVAKLSGGMKRRVSIACAIANDQPVLIMDEPTTSLDFFHRENIHAYIKKYMKRNGIVIMSTHDIEEMHLADRIYYMHDGILKCEDADDVITSIKLGG